MSYELIYRVDLGSAQSPFRVVAQPAGREVGWINGFLDQCCVRGLAWHTLRGYAFALTHFVRWWAERHWTQKGTDNAGQGRIFRAGIDIPKGQTPSARKDIELLYDALPEPIDLDLDLANRTMYWTDRGDPPRGNTVNRAPMDTAPGAHKSSEIIFNHLMEGIGLALDLKNNRIFMTDLGGSVYSANLDGSNKKNFLFAQGNLSGIAYAEIPSTSEKTR